MVEGTRQNGNKYNDVIIIIITQDVAVSSVTCQYLKFSGKVIIISNRHFHFDFHLYIHNAFPRAFKQICNVSCHLAAAAGLIDRSP